jgi:hypothetical protein
VRDAAKAVTRPGAPDMIFLAFLVAADLEAPITKVTVHTDRARVVRTASVQLAAGEHRLRFPDLPGATLTSSLRVSSDKGRVLRIETQSVDRERFSLDEVDGLIETLEKLDDKDRTIDAELRLLDKELAVFASLTPEPPVPEEKRQGRPANPVAASEWPRVLDFFGERRTGIFERKRALQAAKQKNADERRAAQRAAGRFYEEAFSDRKLATTVVIEAAASERHVIDLEYVVSGARWRPAYGVRVDTEKGLVRLDRAAIVSQASGEAWTRVELAVSTAAARENIKLPELLTWTLGEAKEPVLKARSLYPRGVAPKLEAPPPPLLRAETAETSARLSLLQQRKQTLMARAGFARDSRSGAVEKTPGGAAMDDVDEMPSPEPTKPAEVAEEAYALLPAAVPTADRAHAKASYSAQYLVQSGKAEPAPLVRGLNLAEPARKVADAFGVLMRSPLRLTVPAQANEVKVPLRSDDLKAAISYEATPAIELKAFMVATIDDARGLPTGNAAIYIGDTFIADSAIAPNGAGKLLLPLGPDNDVRITRKMMPNSVTEGVFSKDDATTYKVVIEIGNYKRRSITLRVTEPLPKSVNEKLKIELLSASQPPAEKNPDSGHLVWTLNIAANQTQTIELVYKLTRPSDMEVWTR